MDGLEFDPWQVQEMLLISLSRMTVQFHWYKGFVVWVEHQGTRLTTFFCLVLRLWITAAVPVLTLCAFMTWTETNVPLFFNLEFNIVTHFLKKMTYIISFEDLFALQIDSVLLMKSVQNTPLAWESLLIC